MPRALLLTVGTGNASDLEGSLYRPLTLSIQESDCDRIILLPSLDTAPHAAVVRDRFKDRTVEVQPLPKAGAEDDVDACFAHFSRVIAAVLSEGISRDDIAADFTRGTKAMSAALVLAAVIHGVSQLRYVSGNRRDQRGQVIAGSEVLRNTRATWASVSGAIALGVEHWSRFEYDAAYAAFKKARAELAGMPDPPQQMLDALGQLVRLSEGFAAWDRFQYREAHQKVNQAARTVPDLAAHVRALERLKESQTLEPTVLMDLWRNAQRRAEQGRFDDAVARLYRLIEWSAQWLLWRDAGVRTGAVPPNRLPSALAERCQPNKKGNYMIGLEKAWAWILEEWPHGPAATFMAACPAGSQNSQHGHMKNLIRIRNDSFLAHGSVPIGKEKWEKFAAWMEGGFLAMLKQEADAAGLPIDVPQLPRTLPGELAGLVGAASSGSRR